MRRSRNVYTKHWWLNPAVRNATSSSGTPTRPARNECVSRTLWHTPTTFVNGEPAYTPHGTIAIGFV